jgi:hypothetical protein
MRMRVRSRRETFIRPFVLRLTSVVTLMERSNVDSVIVAGKVRSGRGSF